MQVTLTPLLIGVKPFPQYKRVSLCSVGFGNILILVRHLQSILYMFLVVGYRHTAAQNIIHAIRHV